MKLIILITVICSLILCGPITELDFSRINEQYYSTNFMSEKECEKDKISCFISLSSKEILEFLYEASLRNESAQYVPSAFVVLSKDIGKSISYSELNILASDSNLNPEFRTILLEFIFKYEAQLSINRSELVNLLDHIASDSNNNKKFVSYAIGKMARYSTDYLPSELLTKYRDVALNVNAYEDERIQSIIFLSTNRYPDICNLVRTILIDENTSNSEVIGQALLTLSEHSSNSEDIELINNTVALADDVTVFKFGIAALGNIGTDESIDKIISHQSDNFANRKNISHGLRRCSNLVLSLPNKAITIDDIIYAINCLKLLGTKEAYELLKELRSDQNNSQEVIDKLDESIRYFDDLINTHNTN